MLPPHLPKPTVNPDQRRKIEQLKLLLVLVAISLLAGVAGSLVALSWLWPKFGEGYISTISNNRADVGEGQLNDQIARDLLNQTLSVYAKVTETNGVESFSPKDFIGAGAVVGNSDGWLVLYAKNSPLALTQWRALSNNGKVYVVSQAVADSRAGLLYIKVADVGIGASRGEQFQGAARFAEDLQKSDSVFVFERGAWQQAQVESAQPIAPSAHLDSHPTPRLTLNRSFSAGDLAVTPDGKFAGFIIGGNAILPNAPIKNLWPAKVINKKTVAYPTLGAMGWYSDEQTLLANGQIVSGFLVTQVVSQRSLLKRGDIITYVSGQPMNVNNLWDSFGAATVKLIILRAGKTLEITTPVVQL